MRPLLIWVRRCLASASAFVVADQFVVSLGNFGTNLLLIRTLEPSVFGVYAVLWSVMLLLNMLQSSLIVHPMLVMAASAGELGARKLAGAALSATLAAAPIAAGVLFTAASGLHHADAGGWIILASLSWQVQEVLRRSLISRRQYRRCIPGDSISYLGQAIVLLLLSRFENLSLVIVFASMAGTSILAAALQAYQARPVPSRVRDLVSDFREFWKIGQWIANLNVVASVTTTALPWALAFFRGSVAVAGYQALLYCVGIVQPLAFSLGSVVAVETARWSASGMVPESARKILRPVAAGGLGILCYSAILLLFPGTILRLLSGSGSAYLQLTQELRLFALAGLLLYSGHMLNEALIGLRETRKAFLSQCSSALACIAVSLPLLMTHGVLGAAFGLVAAHLAKTLSSAMFLHRMLAPRFWPVAEARAGASGAM